MCVYSPTDSNGCAKITETGSCVLRNENAAAFDFVPLETTNNIAFVLFLVRLVFSKLRVQNHMKESHLLRPKLCKVYGTRNAGWN